MPLIAVKSLATGYKITPFFREKPGDTLPVYGKIRTISGKILPLGSLPCDSPATRMLKAWGAEEFKRVKKQSGDEIDI